MSHVQPLDYSLTVLVGDILYLYDPDKFFSIKPIQDVSSKPFCKTRVPLRHLRLS